MSKDKTNIEEITPKEIYLQAFTDDGLSYKDAGEEVTWCEDKVSDEDIKYIREDQVQAECEKYLDGFKTWLKNKTKKQHLTIIVDDWHKQGYDIEIGVDLFKKERREQG